MKTIIAILSVLIMVTILSSCGGTTSKSNSEANTKTGLGGLYTGKMTFDKFDEAFYAAYRAPGEKVDLASEIGQANEQARVTKKKIDISSIKSLPKEGTIAISIYNNVKKDVADGDYLTRIVDNFSGYSRFLPQDTNVPYWALFKDKRRGDVSITLSSTVFQLENTVKGDSSRGTNTYKLNGSINGKIIKGAWSLLLDGTEVYAGTFEATKTTAVLGDM